MRGQAVTNSDRCEGLVKHTNSRPGLHIASLTTHFEDFPHSESHNLLIQWSAPDSAQVSIGAIGISDRRQTYRMDTVRPAADSVFVWRRNIVSRYGINRDDLGLTATASLKVAGRKETVYIPLKISERPFTGRPASISLVVLPENPVDRIAISITDINNTSTLIWKDQIDISPSDRAVHPVEIAIPVDMLPGRGIYRLTVTSSDAALASTDILFYNPFQSSPLLIENTRHHERKYQDDANQAQERIGLPEPE